MRILALDVGNRRTGVAFLDDAVGIPLPLDTLMHQSMEELLPQIEQILTSRSVDRVIVGLPRLPSGEEGSQAGVSRSVGEKNRREGIPCRLRGRTLFHPSEFGS
jgi:putative Holliday junction resolvase